MYHKTTVGKIRPTITEYTGKYGIKGFQNMFCLTNTNMLEINAHTK